MFERILLSVDTSEDSGKAVDLTREMAKTHGSRVVVVHGRDVLVNPSGRPAPPRVEHRETKADAQHLVDTAVAELQGEGVDARGEVLPGQGRVGRKILEVAEAEHADLIVLGSRSMSRLEEIISGSPSQKVVHAAKCPVLLVR